MKFTARLLPVLVLLSLLTVSARGDLILVRESGSLFAGDSMGAGAGPSSPGLGTLDASASGSWVYPGDRRPWAPAGPDSILSSGETTAPGHAGEEGPFSTYESHARRSSSVLHADAAGEASSRYVLTDQSQAWRDYRRTDYSMYSAKLELSKGTGLVFSASMDPANRSLADRASSSTLFSHRALVAILSLSVPLP